MAQQRQSGQQNSQMGSQSNSQKNKKASSIGTETSFDEQESGLSKDEDDDQTTQSTISSAGNRGGHSMDRQNQT